MSAVDMILERFNSEHPGAPSALFAALNDSTVMESLLKCKSTKSMINEKGMVGDIGNWIATHNDKTQEDIIKKIGLIVFTKQLVSKLPPKLQEQMDGLAKGMRSSVESHIRNTSNPPPQTLISPSVTTEDTDETTNDKGQGQVSLPKDEIKAGTDQDQVSVPSTVPNIDVLKNLLSSGVLDTILKTVGDLDCEDNESEAYLSLISGKLDLLGSRLARIEARLDISIGKTPYTTKKGKQKRK